MMEAEQTAVNGGEIPKRRKRQDDEASLNSLKNEKIKVTITLQLL